MDEAPVVIRIYCWSLVDVRFVHIPGQLELIRSVLEGESIAFDQLKQVIITHQDRDHIGSLPEIVEASGGNVQVLAHELARAAAGDFGGGCRLDFYHTNRKNDKELIGL